MSSWLAGCLSLLIPAAASAETAVRASGETKHGSVVGTVSAQVTQQPIERASVRVLGLEQTASTDADGRFRIDGVPLGTHRLLVEKSGHLPAAVPDVVVTAGRETPVVIHLQETVTLHDTVSVEASYFEPPLGVTSGAYAMSYEEIRRAPGAVGDVNRMLQSLPGTIARDDQRNDIIARGGSPTENLVMVDNLEVPNLSHFGGQGTTGGPITMLNAETVSEASFLAGGFPAAYGGRLSSVLDVSLREGNRKRFEAELDLGMAGAGLLLEGPIGRRGSWLVSGRRSYLDFIASAWNMTDIPEYSNFQAKIVYDVNRSNKLTLLGLGGLDSIRIEPEMDDTDDPNTLIIDDRGWRYVAGLNWQTLLGTKGVGILSLGHSENSFEADIWEQRLNGQLIERNRSRERETTAKYDLTYRFGRLATARAGVFAKRIAPSYEIRLPLGQESVFSTDASRINPLALDERFSTWQGGGYLEISPRVGSLATANLGLRYERYQLNEASAISPRAGLTLHLRRNLDLSATFGRFFQNPPLVFMRAFAENRHLRPMRADHYVAGLAYRPRPDVKITIEGYHKRYARYPVSTQYPSVTAADLGEQVDVHFYLIPYKSEGLGRSSGVELYVQKKMSGRLWGQVSYAYTRTEQRALDGLWRSGSFDLPHTLAVVVGVKPGRSLDLSAKFSFSSGRPATPFLPESYVQNRMIFDLARYNAERAPDYHRLDLRADRRTSHRWGNVVFYVELDNVYDRKNVRYYEWNPKTRERRATSQLTFMGIGGVNVEF